MPAVESREVANSTFDRTAGSHSLAAAGHRERWADLKCTEES